MTRSEWTHNGAYGPSSYGTRQDYFSQEPLYRPRQPSLPSVSTLISTANPAWTPLSNQQPDVRSESPRYSYSSESSPTGQPTWQQAPNVYGGDSAIRRPSSGFGPSGVQPPPGRIGAAQIPGYGDGDNTRMLQTRRLSEQHMVTDRGHTVRPPQPHSRRPHEHHEDQTGYDGQSDPYMSMPRPFLGYPESRSAGTTSSAGYVSSNSLTSRPHPRLLSISNLLDKDSGRMSMSSTAASLPEEPAYAIPSHTPTYAEPPTPISPSQEDPAATAGVAYAAAAPKSIALEAPVMRAPLTRSTKQMSLPGTTQYHLTVRQQPVAGRMCGYGERDRRVIDPPPILQLTLDDATLAPAELTARLRGCQCVVHCTIWDSTGTADKSHMEDYQEARRLMGTTVSSSFMGFDEYGNEGCFFPFPDLSCRTSGAYRLKFSLVVLAPTKPRRGHRIPFSAVAMSNVFFVYSPREFPGMQPSSALTHCLRDQGCMISLKKGNYNKNPGSGRRISSLSDDDGGDDDDYDDGPAEATMGLRRLKPNKKPKRYEAS